MQALPTETLIEIGKCNWQAWRLLQQCSAKLYAPLIRIDPYEAFTKVEVIDNDVDEPRLAWKDKDGIIIRVFIISSCSFTMLMYRDGKSYEYDSHFVMWRPPFHEDW
nr:hypothetical protein K-LCC10_0418 [Kaumoebavirus]